MAETLEEYLVKLGFEVDEITHARFWRSLAQTKGTIKDLAEAAVAAAVAVAVSVEKMALVYNDLYYMSHRTNTSIGALQSFGFAAKQIGLNAETAKAAIDSMSLAMARNPNLPSFFSTITGIADPERHPKETIEKLIELVKLGKMPFWLGAQYAEMGGMDPATFRQFVLEYKDYKKQTEDFEKMQRRMGIDPKKIGDQSHQLFLDTNMMLATATAFVQYWIKDWIEPTDKLVKQISRAFEISNKWYEGSAQSHSLWEWLWGPGLDGKGGFGIGGAKAATGAAGLQPEFAKNLERLMAAVPPELGRLRVGSGYRTQEEQAALYAQKPWLAAPPGKSPHERGTAADLEGPEAALAWARQHAGEYNTRFPMLGGPGHKYEPWHIEPMGAGGGKSITNNFHTTMHVDGTGDPKQVASLVLDGQRRLWADVVRNMGGALA
jgi:D-alanyl-D-alanine carboxypeptidase